MENNNEIRNRIVNFMRGRNVQSNTTAVGNAMYGFYVSRFGKMCDQTELPEKLADELISANKDTKQAFLDIVEELDASLYDRMGLRVCSECGKFIKEGFYLAGDYACSEDCALKNYMRTCNVDVEEAGRMFANDLEYDDEHCSGEAYWTEW